MKKMPLTRGKFALVDDDDFDYLSQWKWLCTPEGYALRRYDVARVDGKRRTKSVFMHRVINKTPDGMETDHIDMDKLNNQKSNLRSCSGSQNQGNRVARPGTSSKYKSVYWNKKKKRWEASISIDGKLKYLGRFKGEEDAARAYNEAAIKHHGEFARLNEI